MGELKLTCTFFGDTTLFILFWPYVIKDESVCWYIIVLFEFYFRGDVTIVCYGDLYNIVWWDLVFVWPGERNILWGIWVLYVVILRSRNCYKLLVLFMLQLLVLFMLQLLVLFMLQLVVLCKLWIILLLKPLLLFLFLLK